jgi:hypothetical protein
VTQQDWKIFSVPGLILGWKVAYEGCIDARSTVKDFALLSSLCVDGIAAEEYRNSMPTVEVVQLDERVVVEEEEKRAHLRTRAVLLVVQVEAAARLEAL